MANDKKSSIYDDQSGAGSVSELDEYGVWVKSDPAETSASKKGDSDFLIPDDESSPDFEIGEIEEVSADELDIPMAEDIDDFEKEFIPEDLENGAEDVDALSFDNTLDPELDDIEELQVEDILKADPDFLAMETQKITEVPTIDALSLGDDTEEFAELASGLSAIDETASDESASEGGASNGETSQTDVAGENIASSEETPAHREGVDEKGATELFIEDFLDDSPFDDDEIMKKEKDAEEEKSAVAPTGDAPVVEAESVPVEAEEAVDAAVAPTGDAPVVEAESVPVEAEEAVDVAAGDAPVEAEPVLAETERAVDEAVALAGDAPREAKPEKPTVQPIAQTNLSTELLLRIAEELSSIRQELSTLKQDFLAIRTHASAICEPEPVENPPEAKKEEAATQNAQGGFFDDSDDEKIALTGNELDNILLSVDYTEEIGMDISKGEPEIVETEATPEEGGATQNAQGGFFDDSDDEKIALTGNELDNVLMSAEFTEEAGEDLSEKASEAVEIEPAPETSEEAIPDAAIESESLRRLQKEGVEPITPAPEDSSYLETDPAASQELEVEDIDLSDVVIDEPDLSGQLQENPLQEPVLEGIAFDDMPLTLSEEELSADIEVEEEPPLEIPEKPVEPVVEEYPVTESFPVEEGPAESVIESFPAEEEPVESPAEPVMEEYPIAEKPAESAVVPEKTASEADPAAKATVIPSTIQQELKVVLSYMDQLLESLPEEKIEEFASSKYFDTYKKLFSELGLV